MKKLVTALLLGTLATSCSLKSDPTKDTNYNFKNGVQKLAPEADIEQKSPSQCNKLLNIQIDNSYTITPGNNLSEVLVAHSLLSGLEIELNLVQSDKNPPGLSLVKVQGQVGEYQLKLDPSQIDTKKNYEVYNIELDFTEKGKDQVEIAGCAIRNKKSVKLIYITETQQIPVVIEDQPLSDEGIVELSHDLNASNTFKVKLPSKSSLKKYPLNANIDSVDIIDYADIKEENYNGVYTITIDKEALAERFAGDNEQVLSLSLSAFVGGSHREDFNVHFNFISNIQPEELTTSDEATVEATTTEAQ